jgi:hypothetical protein
MEFNIFKRIEPSITFGNNQNAINLMKILFSMQKLSAYKSIIILLKKNYEWCFANTLHIRHVPLKKKIANISHSAIHYFTSFKMGLDSCA